MHSFTVNRAADVLQATMILIVNQVSSKPANGLGYVSLVKHKLLLNLEP